MDKPAICGGEPVRDAKIFYGHQYIDDADIQAGWTYETDKRHLPENLRL